MRRDWFAAFATKRNTTSLEYRATRATRATGVEEAQKTADFPVAQSVAQTDRPWATRATNLDPVARVAQPLPSGDECRATPETTENCGSPRSVARVAHVARDLDTESFGVVVNDNVCGQCAVIVKEGQEFLNVVADGFPGVIHLACYDDWYRDHIAGRFPDPC